MTVQQRLERVLKRGNLTVADLSRWFGRPHATVRGWVKGGRLGLAAPLDRAYIESQLKLLEHRIEAKAGLPVSPELTSKKRIAYLDGLRNGAGR